MSTTHETVPMHITASSDFPQKDEPPKNLQNDLDKNAQDTMSSSISNEDEASIRGNWFSKRIEMVEDAVSLFVKTNCGSIKLAVCGLLYVVYLAYFGYCMYHRFGDEGSIILLVITVFLLLKTFVKALESRGTAVRSPRVFDAFLASKTGRQFRKVVRYSACVTATTAMLVYLGMEVFPKNPNNVQSFLGMLVLILICFVFSAKPSRVNWHPVFWAFFIQCVVALVTLRTTVGYEVFKWLGNLIQTLFAFSDSGSEVVIGNNFQTMGLAFSASGVIIFTNALMCLMNQWGVIEFIILRLGGFLAFCLETGPVESVVAAANIFIGLTEAPLMVRPYLPTVTKSELLTIMACGFASISGGLMALFIRLGAPANHLLTAAVISAPATLAIAKLMYPETERVVLESQHKIRMVDKKDSNSLNAFSEGAVLGVGICAAVWSNMLAFVSILSLVDSLVGWFGDRAGVDGLTFGVISSYVLFPFSFLMGVEVGDCRKIGELIGIKIFSTPVVSYQQLGFLIKNRVELENYMLVYNETSWHWDDDDVLLEATNTVLKGGFLSERSEVIATYALCGFSAFASIGITLGSLVPVCPPRKQDVIDIIMRAFIAGNMACFATGAIAGVLY